MFIALETKNQNKTSTASSIRTLILAGLHSNANTERNRFKRRDKRLKTCFRWHTTKILDKRWRSSWGHPVKIRIKCDLWLKSRKKDSLLDKTDNRQISEGETVGFRGLTTGSDVAFFC